MNVSLKKKAERRLEIRNYYGIAYKLSYEEEFYYGDIRGENGSLPNCFVDDVKCQVESQAKDNKSTQLAVCILLSLVLVFTAVGCYCVRRSKKKKRD